MLSKYKTIAIILAASLLAACNASYMSSNNPASSWGNYRCQAVSAGGASYVGWAATSDNARSNALAKCRANSGGGACAITQCVNQA